MGILTGLFKSMMLTRMINTKQHEVTKIMSKISRIKRESSNVETEIANRLSQSKQEARLWYQQQMVGYSQSNPSCVTSSELTTEQNTYNTQLYQYNRSAYMTQIQSQMQAMIDQATQEAETEKDIYLEDLKDQETALENEKTQLEAEIKLYEQWKQASQEETQNSIKNFKPLGSSSYS